MSREEPLQEYLHRPSRDRLEKVVHEYYRFVWQVAFRLTRNNEDAADICQDVFLKLLLHPARPRKNGSPRAYLSWCVLSRHSHLRMAAKRRLSREIEGAARLAGNGVDAGNLEALHDALSRLPEELRIPIELRYLDGLRNEEISQILEVSERTVGHRLARARRLLGQRLKPLVFALAAVDASRTAEVPPHPPADLLPGLLQITEAGTALSAPLAGTGAGTWTATGGLIMGSKKAGASLLMAAILISGGVYLSTGLFRRVGREVPEKRIPRLAEPGIPEVEPVERLGPQPADPPSETPHTPGEPLTVSELLEQGRFDEAIERFRDLLAQEDESEWSQEKYRQLGCHYLKGEWGPFLELCLAKRMYSEAIAAAWRLSNRETAEAMLSAWMEHPEDQARGQPKERPPLERLAQLCNLTGLRWSNFVLRRPPAESEGPCGMDQTVARETWMEEVWELFHGWDPTLATWEDTRRLIHLPIHPVVHRFGELPDEHWDLVLTIPGRIMDAYYARPDSETFFSAVDAYMRLRERFKNPEVKQRLMEGLRDFVAREGEYAVAVELEALEAEGGDARGRSYEAGEALEIVFRYLFSEPSAQHESLGRLRSFLHELAIQQLEAQWDRPPEGGKAQSRRVVKEQFGVLARFWERSALPEVKARFGGFMEKMNELRQVLASQEQQAACAKYTRDPSPATLKGLLEALEFAGQGEAAGETVLQELPVVLEAVEEQARSPQDPKALRIRVETLRQLVELAPGDSPGLEGLRERIRRLEQDLPPPSATGSSRETAGRP